MASPCWTVIYSGPEVVHGRTREDWCALADGAQVVIVWRWDGYRGWAGMPEDRTVWTGLDHYDPFDTGCPVAGRLVSDDAYAACWDLATRLTPPEA